MAANRGLPAQAEQPTRADRIVLDIDSSESPVHGAQERSGYNAHFESICCHPLSLFNAHGDCLAATLRPGNLHSAEDWADLLAPETDRQQAEGKRAAFRADAAFAKPEINGALEQREADSAIRIPANKNLQAGIEGILFRPPGRPSRVIRDNAPAHLGLAGPGGLTAGRRTEAIPGEERPKRRRSVRQMARKPRVSVAVRSGVAGFTVRGRDDEEFRFKRGVGGVACGRDSAAKSGMSGKKCLDG